MGLLKKLFGAKEEVKINKTTTDDFVYLDIGNSSIKAIYKNKRVCFRASIKKVDPTRITIQKNAMLQNQDWFVIGEDTTPLNIQSRKIDRNHIKELITYTLLTLGINEETGIRMLLPYNQLRGFQEWKQKLLGETVATLNLQKKVKIKIPILEVYPEGEVILNCVTPTRPEKVIIDFGGGTIDIFVFDINNNLINKVSLNVGTRNLIARYVEALGAKNSTVVEKYFKYGYKFNKEQLESVNAINQEFLDEIMTDIFNVILDYCNPQATELIFAGGGSLTLKDSIQKWFRGKEFKCTFLPGEKSIFANLEGLIKFTQNPKLKKQISQMTQSIEIKIPQENTPTKNDLPIFEEEIIKEITQESKNENITQFPKNGAKNPPIGKIDKKELDQKIMEFLDEGLSQELIGTKLGLTRDKVRYRIKKLKEKGVI